MQVRMRQAAFAFTVSLVLSIPLTGYATCEGSGTAVVVRPVRDTRVMQAHPSANDGLAGLIWLKRSSDVRGLVGFDLSCQAAATTCSASLEVSIYEGYPSLDGATFAAHRMTVPWVEGNQSFNEFSWGGNKLGSFGGTGAGVTWDCRVDGDLSDNTSEQCSWLDRWDGANDCGAGVPCFDVPGTTASFDDEDQETLAWDVTAGVLGAEGETSWLLKVEDEDVQSGSVKFYTRDGARFMAENDPLPGAEARFDEAPRLLLYGSGLAVPSAVLVEPLGVAVENPAPVRIRQEGLTVGDSARWANLTTGDWGWMSPDVASEWTASVVLASGPNEIEFTVYDGCGTEGTLRETIVQASGEYCGNFFVEPGEECDDGNVQDGDCCSASCTAEADGSPCEDSDVCTVGDLCVAGQCSSGSVEPPTCGRSLVCYRAKTTSGTASFDPIDDLVLTDSFGSGLVDIKKAKALCVPGTVDGDAPIVPETHGVSYLAKRSGGQSAPTPSTVTVRDRFGTVDLRVKKVSRALAAASRESGGPASPLPPGTADAYKCYRVVAVDGKSFPKGLVATVADEFDDRTYFVKRPSRLCAPIEELGAGAPNPDAYLMCYRVSRFAGEPKHEKVRGLLHLNDDFGESRLDTRSEEELCVVAEVM